MAQLDDAYAYADPRLHEQQQQAKDVRPGDIVALSGFDLLVEVVDDTAGPTMTVRGVNLETLAPVVETLLDEVTVCVIGPGPNEDMRQYAYQTDWDWQRDAHIEKALGIADAAFEAKRAAGMKTCTLDTHPNSTNWVERSGGLPKYLCYVAKGIFESGKAPTIGRAIAIAVGAVHRWCAGKQQVKPTTRALACQATAEWAAKVAAVRAGAWQKSTDPTQMRTDQRTWKEKGEEGRMGDLGKVPRVMHFAEGDYVVDASRQYFDGPLDDAGAALKAYEAEIERKKAEKKAKFESMKKSADFRPVAIITQEDVSDIELYLATLE